MLLGFSALANAAEFKFSGTLIIASEYTKTPSFNNSDNGFGAMIRFRPRFDAIINENLYSSLQLQIGTYNFGQRAAGIGSRANSNIQVRQAFIAVKMPGLEQLSMTLGIQNMAPPSATLGSNFILDDSVGGISIGYAITDSISINAAWSRPYAVNSGTTTRKNGASAIDYAQFDLPMDFSKVKISPWGAVAAISKRSGIALAQGDPDDLGGNSIGEAQSGLLNMGQQSGANAGTLSNGYVTPTKSGIAWWAGAAIELNVVQNLHIGIDFVYGATDFGKKEENRQGFMGAIEISYKMNMFTPAIKYWYASGNSKNSGISKAGGLMPSISPCYYPLYFGFADSSVALGYDGMVGGYTTSSTQGVVLELQDITFVNNLTHLFQLGYVMGTTDKNWVKDRVLAGAVASNAEFNPTFLTTKDSILALNFITTYQIYENFSTTFGVGYMHLLTTNSNWASKPKTDALSVALGFTYAF